MQFVHGNYFTFFIEYYNNSQSLNQISRSISCLPFREKDREVDVSIRERNKLRKISYLKERANTCEIL